MRPSRLQGLLLQGPVVATVCGLLALPTVLLLLNSLSQSQIFQVQLGGWQPSNYLNAVEDVGYRTEALRSLLIGLQTTLSSTLGGFALAYWVRFRAKRTALWLFLIAVSLIASYIVRVYAWRTLLGPSGVVVSVLASVGLVAKDQSVLLFTPTAVVLAQTQVFLPFTALILASSLLKVDVSLIEQARNLGYSRTGAVCHVTLPLIGPALLGALCFTFFLASGDYLTPALVGGVDGTTLGAVIANEFQTTGNYVNGAVLSFEMLALFIAFFVAVRSVMRVLGLLPRTT